MKKRHIIIGVSAAGIGAVTKLRALDKKCQIICIAAQDEPPYNTCLLVDLLAKNKREEQIFTKPISFFQENNIILKLSTQLTKISPKKKTITVSLKQEFSYDSLFLSLGTRARKPAIPGIDLRNVFSFHTLQDTHQLLNYADHNKVRNILVIGAGLSGIECADALHEYGYTVTIVERSSRVLLHHVDNDGSHFIVERMRQKGIYFLTNRTVIRICQRNNFATGVLLDDGTEIEADIIIFAVGALPNNEIAQQAGIELYNGRIRTNKYMQTSCSDIFAGGDVCVVKERMSGRWIPSTTWPDAMMQGMIAAYAMAGVPKVYQGIVPRVSSHFFDLPFVSCGPVSDLCYTSEVLRGDHFYHKIIICDDGIVRGFLMIGKVHSVGLLRQAVLCKELYEKICALPNFIKNYKT